MQMQQERKLSPAKRQRLLQTLGSWPAGYTKEDLELALDLLYRLFSHVCTMKEIRQMVVSDPFDRTDTPRTLKLVDLTDWLETLLST
jgi:hypothetical protein